MARDSNHQRSKEQGSDDGLDQLDKDFAGHFQCGTGLRQQVTEFAAEDHSRCNPNRDAAFADGVDQQQDFSAPAQTVLQGSRRIGIPGDGCTEKQKEHGGNRVQETLHSGAKVSRFQPDLGHGFSA